MAEPITLLLLRPIFTEIAKNLNSLLTAEFSKRFKSKNFSINNQQLVDSIEKIGSVKTLFTGADKPVDINSFFYLPWVTTKDGIKKNKIIK